MWGDLGRQREGRDRKVHLTAYYMPSTLQDTLLISQKLANLFLPTQDFSFNRGSVTTNGIMLQVSPCQLIPGMPKWWREDNAMSKGMVPLTFPCNSRNPLVDFIHFFFTSLLV